MRIPSKSGHPPLLDRKEKFKTSILILTNDRNIPVKCTKMFKYNRESYYYLSVDNTDINAITYGYANLTKLYYQNGKNYDLPHAIANGHLNIIKILRCTNDIEYTNTQLSKYVYLAVNNGYFRIVIYVKELLNVQLNTRMYLELSSMYGYYDVVRYILKFSHKQMELDRSLLVATMGAYTKIAMMLITFGANFGTKINYAGTVHTSISEAAKYKDRVLFRFFNKHLVE
jgi:hypothetical protein